ncbi:hypothetical protein [Aquimarina sp. AU119]|uniref:hypothetical protein n=1 Tax=Aquimarina sp. AU119 TaxID=2108528 RepID=UPI000D68B48C|nr:hypothetical protein [Aquimarina sp. AU119]
MNKILYILIFIGLFSCKSNSVAKEKETEKGQQKPKVEKPKFSDLKHHDALETNTVHLVAVIQDVNRNISICGQKYNAVTTVKVKSITGLGSSIVNMISAGQEITFAFMKLHSKDFDALKQKLAKDQKVSFKVREGLCFDSAKTVYEIITFEIIN